ncbi:MAG: YSC84-related protein [Pseudomonadota bacterium]
MTLTRRQALTGTFAMAAMAPGLAQAEDATVIDARVNIALQQLYKQIPGSQELAGRAQAVLVMPDVVKGGFIVGGAYGEGALRLNDGSSSYSVTERYYSVGAASVGLQAGLQQTSHAIFFLTESALDGFRRKDGWQIGADAEVTFPDAGLNLGLDSTTYDQPIIGFVFGEDGLLLGASLEGSKYSRIER